MALLKKQLSSSHFKSETTTNIRYSKQQSLQPGAILEFEWKDYSSDLFRNIQELGGITYKDYLISVCRQETLKELGLRGGCGRPFYLSHDDRFVIKSVRKSEAKVLIEMLPSYYAHIEKYENSLLAKYYGLHAARPSFGGQLGQKVYFVVMENLFQSELHLHRRYDLKGSSQGRSPSKVGGQPRSTLKDLDFDLCLYLEPSLRNQLIEQIKIDCKFLEEQGIMDYSLLLGVHIEPPGRVSTDKSVFVESFNAGSREEPTLDEPTQSQHETHTNGAKPIRPHHTRDPTLSDFFPSASRFGSRFGAKIPARVTQLPQSDKGSVSRRPRVPTCQNVYLYTGIIDILQNYNMIKRIEHAYKSLQYDPKSISSVKPKLYSSRFQDFLCKVFLAEESHPQSPELLLHNYTLS